MIRLSMVGVTHRGAPLSLLESVSMPRRARDRLAAALRDAGFPEVVVLSTCSRTEIYAGPSDAPVPALLTVLAEHAGLKTSELLPAAELREGRHVVEHLFRVTAGLESRVIGEVEIHAQVRAAFREAQAAGTVAASLGQLFPVALRCGSRVREETSLGALGRSTGHRAVDLGLAALTDVAHPVVMVVGSGRMASTAVAYLRRLGLLPQVAARNEVDAARLVGPGLVWPLPDLARGVGRADLLICATSAAHCVITLDHVREAMAARSRPLTVVDLSVPRNVDAAVAAVPGVRLVNLEGMNDDASTDPVLAAALHAGSQIVTSAAQGYADALAARAAGPVIAQLRQRVKEVCLLELARVVPPGGMGADDLERVAHAIAGKLLHRPTMAARAAAAAGDADVLMCLRDIFGVGSVDLDRSSAAAVPQQVRRHTETWAPRPVA